MFKAISITIKIILVIAVFFSIASSALAAAEIKDMTRDVAQKGGFSVSEVNDLSLSQTIGKIIQGALGLVGMIFFVLTFVAGAIWMTAAGNEERSGKARKIFYSSMIGLIITLASWSISFFVMKYILIATSPFPGQ